MTEWNEGAIVDIAAQPLFHREMTPIWLAAACTLAGHRPPALTEPFRYADFGRGGGFTALTVAATFPRAEVWGFDINPANVETARALAGQAGLGNVRFQEISLAALAAAPPDALPEFDFMVADGLLSILSPEGQGDLYALIERHLRPGGLVCLGYDAATGWTEVVPLQSLMRTLYDRGADVSDLAVPGLIARLERLKAVGALYFQRNPALDRHLAALKARPADDVALTLLNRDWNPLMFADAATAMAEARCDFITRATLEETVPWASAPPAMADLLDNAPSVRIRETMQDIAARTAYRRDIYRRGLTFMPIAEHRRRLEALAVAATGEPLGDLPTWQGTIPADPALYGPLSDALRDGPLTVATASTLGSLAGCPVGEAANAIAMLIAAGHAHPAMPDAVAREATPGVARLNDALIDAVTRGEDIGYLVSPRLGAAIAAGPLEILTAGALSRGLRPDDPGPLASAVLLAMRQGGRVVTHDGVAVEDETQATSILRTAIGEILAHRVPLFRALGILTG